MKSKKDALETIEMMLEAEKKAFNRLMESDHKLSSEAGQYLVIVSANQETLTKMVAELVKDSVNDDHVSRRVYTGPRER